MSEPENTVTDLPVWTVVLDVSDDGSPLVVVVRATDANAAFTQARGPEAEALAAAHFHEDDTCEPGWLEDATYGVLTFHGNVAGAVADGAYVVDLTEQPNA